MTMTAPKVVFSGSTDIVDGGMVVEQWIEFAGESICRLPEGAAAQGVSAVRGITLSQRAAPEESLVVCEESGREAKHLLDWELRAAKINQYFSTERKRADAIIDALGAEVVEGVQLRDSSGVVCNGQARERVTKRVDGTTSMEWPDKRE